MSPQTVEIDEELSADGSLLVSDLPDAAIEWATQRSRAYLLGILLLQTTFLAVVLSRSWFFQDDIENFGLARDEGLTMSYLREGIFGHFAPGHRFLDWFVFHYWPLDWRIPAVLLVTALLATSFVLYRVVRLLSPDKAWPTLLISLFAFSPAVIGTAYWWAAAAHSVPEMLFVSIATLTALRFSRRPTVTDAAVFGVALAAGLLFYEKTALAPLGIAALLWAANEVRGVQAMARLARQCLPLIGISVVLITLWAIEVKSGGYDEGVPSPSVHTWFEWLWQVIRAGPFAFAAGVNPNVYHGTVRDGLLSLGLAAFVFVVVFSIVRFRGAWRAWIFFAVAFTPGFTLAAYGRAADFGPGVASDSHYLTEMAPLLVLALAVALTRPHRVRASRHASPHSRAGFVLILLVPVLLISIVSGIRAVDNFGGAAIHRYFDRLANSADALHLNDDPSKYTVLNSDLPQWVVPSAFAPYDEVSEVLPLLPATRGIGFDIDGKPLLMVLPNGNVRKAKLAPIRSFSLMPGARCLGSVTVQIPPSAQSGNDKTMLFAAIEGAPGPHLVTVTKRAAASVLKEIGPYSAPQLVAGSPTGGPVRLLAIGESTLTIAPTSGSCLSELTVLRPEPTQ